MCPCCVPATQSPHAGRTDPTVEPRTAWPSEHVQFVRTCRRRLACRHRESNQGLMCGGSGGQHLHKGSIYTKACHSGTTGSIPRGSIPSYSPSELCECLYSCFEHVHPQHIQLQHTCEWDRAGRSVVCRIGAPVQTDHLRPTLENCPGGGYWIRLHNAPVSHVAQLPILRDDHLNLHMHERLLKNVNRLIEGLS